MLPKIAKTRNPFIPKRVNTTPKVVKMCDLDGGLAATVFAGLNEGKVHFEYHPITCEPVLITDTEPSDLIYPEGWYYAKGSFRNKHKSTTGMYSEIYMVKSDGSWWKDLAIYCTLFN